MFPLLKTWTKTVFFVAIAASMSAPDCQSTAPSQGTLNVHTNSLTIPPDPFRLVYASNNIASVALGGGTVGVLNTSSLTPTLIREITLPAPFYKRSFGVNGLAITRDKMTVYVSVSLGAKMQLLARLIRSLAL
jgi:hypothetical protein